MNAKKIFPPLFKKENYNRSQKQPQKHRAVRNYYDIETKQDNDSDDDDDNSEYYEYVAYDDNEETI